MLLKSLSYSDEFYTTTRTRQIGTDFVREFPQLRLLVPPPPFACFLLWSLLLLVLDKQKLLIVFRVASTFAMFTSSRTILAFRNFTFLVCVSSKMLIQPPLFSAGLRSKTPSRCLNLRIAPNRMRVCTRTVLCFPVHTYLL